MGFLLPTAKFESRFWENTIEFLDLKLSFVSWVVQDVEKDCLVISLLGATDDASSTITLSTRQHINNARGYCNTIQLKQSTLSY